MVKKALRAIYENGVFRPLVPINSDLSEGQEVQLIVEEPQQDKNPLALALAVYEGLSDEQLDEIEQIALDRSKFFDESA